LPEEPVARIPWKPIEPLSRSERVTNGSLAALDALRAEWARRLTELPEEERARIRQRSLRRLAIETGIIERLYDVDWGLTLTLIAEGFTRDVVERAGGEIDERTLVTLRAQLDSLGMVLDFVRDDRDLGSSFIKELHQALTRTQDTYAATDALGRVFEAPLPRGEWKRLPNHVLLQDNTLLEYAPPEQVASEIDRLIAMWKDIQTEQVHPIVKAAWLHHRFVQIHPFADGNGRVARALTLLVLEKERYAPLVVDRWHRAEYVQALATANSGTIEPLVRLFSKLESNALASELERPEIESHGLAVDVAHTLAAQLAELRRRRDVEVQQRLVVRATALTGRVQRWFREKGEQIEAAFRQRGLLDVRVVVNCTTPPSPRIHWFRHQIVQSARTAGHYADFRSYTAWCSLRMYADVVTLRFVASVHGSGRDAGVMAVTTFGELESPSGDEEQGTPSPGVDYLRTTKDAFRFVYTESIEELERRSAELEELLDEGLAEALSVLLKRV
jgi:prophage maintenance system killer protein